MDGTICLVSMYSLLLYSIIIVVGPAALRGLEYQEAPLIEAIDDDDDDDDEARARKSGTHHPPPAEAETERRHSGRYYVQYAVDE